MATFIVTTLIDESDTGATPGSPGGAGLSLREAIELARGGDTITFDGGLDGGTISLASGQIGIEKAAPSSLPLVIDGDIDDDLRPDITIDARGASRVMEISPDLDVVRQSPGTPVVLDGLVITGGRASIDAGIQVRSADFTLQNSIVVGNVSDSSGGGVGINNTFGGPALTEHAIINSTISGNTSAGSGAGIVFRRAELTIVNSEISDNEATGGLAGGIFGFDARDLTVVNTTVSGNTVSGDSARTGGILVSATVAFPTTTLTNVTMTGNVAEGPSARTGGIETVGFPLIVRNTIIAGNAAAGVIADVGNSISQSQGTNIYSQAVVNGAIAGDQTGVLAEEVFADVTPIPGTSPVIFAGLLADNGGLTRTVALNPTGPAIDAGDTFTLFGPGPDRVIGTPDDDIIFTDQRGPGFERTVDLDPGGRDIGAFELQSLPTLFTPFDDVVDLNDFDLDTFANPSNALAGDDTVRLSETQRLGLVFYAGEGEDTIEGSGSGDLINGAADADEITGRSGDDRLLGGGGGDTLVGGQGIDELTGNTGDDLLVGGAGTDRLEGRLDDDWLFGGAGVDALIGGGGQDRLVGGADSDVFALEEVGESLPGAATRDVIQDFEGVGIDSGDGIVLSGIDAIPGGLDNAFTFIGTAAFTGLGQVRVFDQLGQTIVAGNATGGLAADFEIAVDDGEIAAAAWRAVDFFL